MSYSGHYRVIRPGGQAAEPGGALVSAVHHRSTATHHTKPVPAPAVLPC